MKSYTTVDKTPWGPGPWSLEPDKVSWTDEETGLPCLAVRNGRSGNWCGYVGIDDSHRLFGKPYNDCALENQNAEYTPCEDSYCDHSPEGLLNAHGGITYSDHCQTGPEESAICHVPEKGQSDHIWWFGFDCAHAWDLSPGTEAQLSRLSQESRAIRDATNVYRDLAYVQSECAALSKQLKELV